jgi:hypothetical protein
MTVIAASREVVEQNGLCKCFLNHLGNMYNTRPNPISLSPSSISNLGFPTSNIKQFQRRLLSPYILSG